MTAQDPNNAVNTTSQPLDNATPVTPPVLPSITAVPTDNSSLPSASPTTVGTEISGPGFDAVMTPPVPDEPAIPVSVPTPVMNAPTPTPVEDAPAIEEKKESPLQALARKLSELKAELVEEVPATDEKPTETVEPIVSEAPVPVPVDVLPTEPAVPPVMPAIDTTLPSEPAASNGNLLGQDLTNLAEQLNAGPVTPDTTIETPVLETAVPESTPVVNTMEVTSPAINDTTSAGAPMPVSQMDFQAQNERDLAPSSPLDELLGGSPKASEPATPESGSSPVPLLDSVPTANSMPEVIDESNNQVVTSQEVTDTKTAGKYPLTIQKVLDVAIDRNASDVLLSVGYPVMLRVDTVLVELHPQILSQENVEELVFPVLTDQKKELLEVNREVDLAYSHRHGGEARFRINAFYSSGHLAAAFRLIPTRIKTIEELQLPAIYSQFASLKQGLVLVTGPTGHGKSTTLAAILQKINSERAVHIITIEDPIEYIFPKVKAVVDQREMHDDTHSWNIALKSCLRQNPDVILVGEMRDYETIASTITLAETGHLVFATVHTNSASQTIDRIIDVFPENQQAQVRAQLANILEAVVAQRLIPIDGGGRRAVSEIMIGTPAVRNLIREGKAHQLDNVIRTSADVGMVSLEHSLVKLVREGLITMDKAQEYAVSPEEVVRLLKS